MHKLLRCQGHEVDGVYAARAAVATDNADLAHRMALALVDELIAVGADRRGVDSPVTSTPRLPEPLAVA